MKLMLVASEKVQVTSTIFRNRFVETLYAPIYRSRPLNRKSIGIRSYGSTRFYSGYLGAQKRFFAAQSGSSRLKSGSRGSKAVLRD